uniref:Coat protein minor n=1 Tax=Potato yellow vein virus TaxID=103881 RepID=H6UWV6_9CLOS|nr:coat protein minor [Potato yellow vein virus]
MDKSVLDELIFEDGDSQGIPGLSLRIRKHFIVQGYLFHRIVRWTGAFTYPYSKLLFDSGTILSLKFKLNQGHILYQFNPSYATGHSFKQLDTSWFSNAFLTLAKPRALRYQQDNEFSVEMDGGNCTLGILGWKCYKIFSSFQPISVEVRLILPCSECDQSSQSSLRALLIPPRGFMRNVLFERIPNPLSLYQYAILDQNSKIVSKLAVYGDADLSKGLSCTTLQIRPIQQKDAELPDISSSENVEFDESNDFRLYKTYELKSAFSKSLVFLCKVFCLNVDHINSHVQIWYGDEKRKQKQLVRMTGSNKELTFQLFYMKDGRGRYLNDFQKSIPISVDKEGYAEIRLGILTNGKDSFHVVANDLKIGPISFNLRGGNISFGSEWLIKKKELGILDPSSRRRITDIFKYVRCFVDGDEKKLDVSRTAENHYQGSASAASNIGDLSVFRIKHVTDIFKPREKEQPDKPVIVPEKQPTIQPEGEKEVVKVQTDQNVDRRNKNLVVINSGDFSKQDVEKIKSVLEKLIIKQKILRGSSEISVIHLKHSIVPSKNSMSDPHSYVVWRCEDGKNRRFYKNRHSKFLNMTFGESPRNVERIYLRSRSAEILEKLRNRVLIWPKTHANKRGLLPEYAYLACDFFKFEDVALSDSERLALNSPNTVISLKNKYRRNIVNVNQNF